VLRNTVSAAIATQQALEAAATEPALLFHCAGLAAPHHSRFAPADRRALDARVEDLFGPKAPGGRGVVLVATQTVEQSLDIDADLLLTDLCPMDVLLQRLGRLHRHRTRDAVRPQGFAEARCGVLVPAERSLEPFITKGKGAFGFARSDFPLAYPDLRVLEATWRLIEARDGWTLPAMNRELVEGATHPEVLAALATDLGDAWAGHAARMDGLRYAEQAMAALGCINMAEPYCAAGFPEGETIATRLGARDRRVAFADPPPSLFAPHSPLDTLTIPHWMAQGIPEDAEPILRPTLPAGPPGTLTSSGPTVRFALGERTYIYDRLGLRLETE